MTDLSLSVATTIVEYAFKKGEELGLKPLTVAVLDSGGHTKLIARADGASLMRPDIAAGKAYGALAVGVGSRWLNANAADRPHFVNALVGASGGKIIPVPGGVLIKAGDAIIGAVGITGDTSDNDEACCIAGIEAAELQYDAG